MSFLNSITWGRQQPQQQQPQPGQAGNQPQQQQPNQQQPNQQQPGPSNGNGSGGPAGNQQQPANSQMNPGGNPSNPLDPFIALMTPPKEVQTAYQQQAAQQNAPLFGDQFTPENIQGHVGKTDFMAGVNPESVQKALGGDHQAFGEVINTAVRNAVSTSIQMSQGMVEHGVKTGTERFGSSLDSRFRDLQLKNHNSKNPALSHPLGKALLSTVTKQIAQANPKLSPDEVNAKGEELFSQFAQMMVAKPEDEAAKKKSEGPDWMDFLQEPQ